MNILRYGGLGLVLCGVLTVSAQDAAPIGESVHLKYELTLKRCKANNCTTQSAAKSDVVVTLAPQGADTLAGTQVFDIQAGDLGFHATLAAMSHPQAGSRVLDAKLEVKQKTANAQASGYAHKQAQCVAWNTLPVVDVTTSPYIVGDEQVTPTLEVSIAQ
jgi:hypothetical protein